MSYDNVSRWIREIPGRLKTQEMCDEAVWIEPCSLSFAPVHFKTEDLCIKAVRGNPYTLDYVPDYTMTEKIRNKYVKNMYKNPAAFFLVPDHFKTQEMCIIALEVDPWQLNDIPDYLKTQKMCDNVVRRDPYSLQFVPDCFVTSQQIKIWKDDDEYRDDDELIKWYDGYQKRKPQKAKKKEELMPIAWHLDHVRRLVYVFKII